MKKAPTFHRRLRRRLNFSQNFRKPRAFGARTQLLGAFGPQKWEYPPHPRGKKFGRRHEKIAQNRVFTVVVVTHPLWVEANIAVILIY